MGAVLGGIFQLGPLIRHESDGDVYSVDPLNESTYQPGTLIWQESDVCLGAFIGDLKWKLEAKAFTLSGLQKSQRNPMKCLEQGLCTIYHAGKVFRVYRIEGQKPYHITLDSRTQPQKSHSARKSPKLPTMKAADSSRENDVPEKKKRKKRNRGLKKVKVPRFATIWELESFLGIMVSRLTIQRRKLSAEKSVTDTRVYSVAQNWEQDQRARHKKVEKTTAAMQRQYDALSSRHFWACKQWEDWQTLRAKIFDEVVRWLFDEKWQTFPFGAHAIKHGSEPLPKLLEYYQVLNLKDLHDLEWERIEEFQMVLNGEEKS